MYAQSYVRTIDLCSLATALQLSTIAAKRSARRADSITVAPTIEKREGNLYCITYQIINYLSKSSKRKK